jgi:cytochrome c
MQSTLKTLCLGLAAAGSLLVANIAVAEDIKDFEGFKKLATDSKLLCTTCHQQDKKVIGPSYNAVAVFYKDKKDAAAELEKKILVGGSGVWGGAMMTPNPTAKDHAGAMVKWILSLNPEGDAKKKAEDEIKAMPAPKK